MVDVGLGPYIGLPCSPDLPELARIWARTQSSNTALRSPTLLATLLRTEDEVMYLHSRLKLSSYERDLCLFVVNHRGDKPHPVAIRPYQWLAVDAK